MWNSTKEWQYRLCDDEDYSCIEICRHRGIPFGTNMTPNIVNGKVLTRVHPVGSLSALAFAAMDECIDEI
jgi:hypothetical protein